MDDIKTLLETARRRMAQARFLRGLQFGFAGGALFVLLVVLVAKTSPTFSAALPWTWLLIGVGLVVLGVAIVSARSGRRSDLSTAVLIDERLGLKERLSTALAVKDRSDAFARAAVADAVVAAKDPRHREAMRRAFPVTSDRPSATAWAGPMAAVAAGALWWLLPQGDFFKPSEDETAVAVSRDEAKAALSEVQRAIEQNEQLKSALEKKLGDVAGDALAPDELPKTPEEVRREAIKKLTETTQQLDRLLKSEDAKKLEQVREQLSRLGDPRPGSETEELTSALKAGDFKAAADAIEKLREEAQKDPAKREEIQKQLQELSKQIDKLAESKQGLENELKKAGLDPKLASSPEALERALEQNQNLTEQQKQEIREAAKAQEKAAEKLKELSQQCAGACNSPGGGGQKGDKQDGNQPGQQAGQQGGQQGGQKDGQSGGQQGGQQGGQKPGDKGGQKGGQQGGQRGGQQGGQQGGQDGGSALSELEMLDQLMQAAESAMEEAGQQAEGLGQAMCRGDGTCQGGNQPGQKEGMNQGGHGRATGGRGQVQRTPTGTRVTREKVQTTEGDIIARQAVEGQIDRGQSSVPLDRVIGEVSKAMEQGVVEDEIPQHLQELHKTYFGELKSRMERNRAATQAAQPAPPASNAGSGSTPPKSP